MGSIIIRVPKECRRYKDKRNHLVCEIMAADKEITSVDALHKANAMMRAARKPKRKGSKRATP